MLEILSNKNCLLTDKSLINDRAFLLYLLETMMTVRKFEEKTQELFRMGALRGTAHLSIGEEATGVGTTAALDGGDYILATHRGHGQAIGKGCDINAMMAELFGKSEGLSGGRGGSMHIADFRKGMLGANGIVGANAPLACGAALTIKKKGLNNVSVAFFGDGASNQGAVHEAMNLAAAWDLPVIFCLINNRYAMSTPLKNAVRETDLIKRAAGYGIKAFECDGNDVLQVFETAKTARSHTLAQGPALLVEHTYRMCGHSKSDVNRYRSESEIDEWRQCDPIQRFRGFLLDNGIFTHAELDKVDEKTSRMIEEAASYAAALPEPNTTGILNGIYA